MSESSSSTQLDRILYILPVAARQNGASVSELARALVAGEGTGGGHATMARARVPAEGEWKQLAQADIRSGTRELLNRVTAELARVRATLRSFPPARPVRDRQAASR